MKNAKKVLAAGLITAASMGISSTSHAQTFTEPTSDAGQTLATALPVTGSSLTTINGTIGSSTDADLYLFTITNTTTFSATASSTAGIDTSLFLFTSGGVPVIANDDQSTNSYQGGILAGNTLLTSLAAGSYYLGISLSGNEAINSQGQQLFTTDQPTTTQRGIAAGLNPGTMSDFNGLTFTPETGDYSIALVGAAPVPEPSTYAGLAVGATALGLFLRRRQVKQA